jgi:hypothetical protein
MTTPTRNHTFRNSILKAFSYKCTLSGMDEIQCEAAHIIPFKRNDTEVNGMLLSNELHSLYDKFVWCPIPSTRRICQYRQNFVSYDIEVSDKYDKKELSIHKYKYKRIEVKAWSHTFIEEAYKDFRKDNYPEEFPMDEVSEEKVTCEYCRGTFKKNGLKKHQKSCVNSSRKD